MDTTATFEINEVGSKTGNPYTGTFKVKTLLRRRDEFIADERRRTILGAHSQNAAPNLQGEAFMLGQLSVRVIEAPKWWEENDCGLELVDLNVISAIFHEALSAEKARLDEVKQKSEEALKKLSKS